MGSRLDELIESNRQIYRLLDMSLNGANYTVEPDPLKPAETVVVPPIPKAPSNQSPQLLPQNGFRRRFERLVNLVDNQVTGATYPINPSTLSNAAITDSAALRPTLRRLVAGVGDDNLLPFDNLLLAIRGNITANEDYNTMSYLHRQLTALQGTSTANGSHNALTYLNEIRDDVRAILAAMESAESIEEIKELLSQLIILVG